MSEEQISIPAACRTQCGSAMCQHFAEINIMSNDEVINITFFLYRKNTL